MKTNSYAGKPIRAKTPKQQKYINEIKQKELVFSTGPAGTGKTYISGAMAAKALVRGDYDRLIITRPAVEAEERLGFLPGKVSDKLEPYFAPFRDVLHEFLGVSHVEGMLKTGKIEVAPLAFMRGRSFKDCFIVLDEAQNVTCSQMKLFLTRIGDNSKVIIEGDITQKDIEKTSGLVDAISRLKGHPKVGFVHFGVEDIVRSELCKFIIESYDNDLSSNSSVHLSAVSNT